MADTVSNPNRVVTKQNLAAYSSQVKKALAGKLDASAVRKSSQTPAPSDEEVYSSAASDARYYILNGSADKGKGLSTNDYTTAEKNKLAGLPGSITAGDGIKVEDGKISCTLDTTLYKIVDSLPTEGIDTNKIYLLANASGSAGNTYTEYVYTGSAWEKVGDYQATVDLSGYVKANDKITYEPCTDTEITEMWEAAAAAS